jgi:serine protease Do
MFGRIAAAAVLVALVAACVVVPAPAIAGEKEVKVVIEGDDGGGWLGIGIMELDEKIREKLDLDSDIEGILITEVYDDSPAEEAGLKEHDVVMSIDGEKGKDLSHFVKLVKEKDPGTEVEVQVYRDGKTKTIKATLAERENTFVWTEMEGLEGLKGLEALESLEALKALEHIVIPEIDIGVSSWGRRGRLGVYIEDVSGELAEYFEIPGGEGVLVEGIVEDSPAAEAGIKAGDIIYKIDGKAICCTEELVKAISKMESEKETPIVLIRKGDQVTVHAVVEESQYDKAMQEYKIQIDDLADKEVFIKSLDSHKLTDEERDELKADLKELQEELQELKEELRELAAEKD